MAPADDAAGLIETASSTLALLERCTNALIDKTESSTPLIADGPDPFEVLHDAAKLLKAHTTKLSLLVINKPFTPTAIQKIVKEVTSTCIPAMMSAAEMCRPETYGSTLHEETKFRICRVFREYEKMMQEVIAQGKEAQGEPDTQSKKENQRQHQDSLKFTGIVWESCDALMQLKTLGVVGVVVMKAENYRATLRDAIEELKEWGEGEDEGFSEPDYSDNEVESMLWSSSKLPADREDIKITLELSLRKLKLVNTLFQALIKRRLKTMSGAASDQIVPGCSVPPAVAIRSDQLLRAMSRIPDETDELASAFYDLNDDNAKNSLDQICSSSKSAIELVRLDWISEEDEFTGWSEKWIEALDKC